MKINPKLQFQKKKLDLNDHLFIFASGYIWSVEPQVDHVKRNLLTIDTWGNATAATRFGESIIVVCGTEYGRNGGGGLYKAPLNALNEYKKLGEGWT
jgi:hypothetical protein